MTTTKIDLEEAEFGSKSQVTIGGFNYDNGDVGLSIQERISPLSEAIRGGKISDIYDNVQSFGAAVGIGIAGGGATFTRDPSTGEKQIDANLTLFAMSVGVSFKFVNLRDGVSVQGLEAGVGGIIGGQLNIMGSKVGSIGKLDYVVSYDKTSGMFAGVKAQANYGVAGLGEIDGQFKFGNAFGNTVQAGAATQVGPSTQAYRDFLDYEKFRRNLEADGSNRIPDSDRMQNPLAPTKGPVSVGGPPTTVQTPAGPKVVNPGSTYVPPGSAPPPAPKPVMPPSVTWGQMANPRLPAGAAPPPTAPVQPKLMANPSESNRDRQNGPTQPTSGGSGGGGTGSGKSGGGGSGGSGGGGGSGGSGSGGYVNNGNNPGNKNAPGYNGSSSNSNGGGYVNNGNNPGNKNAPGYNGSGNQNNNNNNNNKNAGNGPARDTSRTGAARPIILDLGGDGFDVSFTGTARFDMDGDGFRERVGWADAQDALLVLDLNADGSRGGRIAEARIEAVEM